MSCGDNRFDGRARVEVRLIPRPALLCHLELPSGDVAEAHRWQADEQATLQVESSNGNVVLRGGNPAPWQDAPWLDVRIYEPFVLDHGCAATQMRFELVNMDSYMGTRVDYGAWS